MNSPGNIKGLVYVPNNKATSINYNLSGVEGCSVYSSDKLGNVNLASSSGTSYVTPDGHFLALDCSSENITHTIQVTASIKSGGFNYSGHTKFVIHGGS